MNKKEIAEIKKQYTMEKNTIARIRGCYVDGEKQVKTSLSEAFGTLDEEEAFKYLAIFKKTLSGTVGKNLLTLDFPLEAELSGGGQEFLLRLRESFLKDDVLTEEFFNRVIDSYGYGENYYIILIDVSYDVPGKASDNMEMYDASDNIYHYLLCSICPVKQSKAGLGYYAEDNRIRSLDQDWVVEAPMHGFVFPCFHDRYSDIHSLLFYSRNPSDLQEDFLHNMFGCDRVPMTAPEQQETFRELVSAVLEDACDYDTVSGIQEVLNTHLEELKEEPEMPELGRQEVRRLFEESGVSAEQLEHFDTRYDEHAGEKTTFLLSNLTASGKLTIDMPEISVQVKPDAAHLVRTEMIDGRQCLVIELNEQVAVNGIDLQLGPKKPEPQEA